MIDGWINLNNICKNQVLSMNIGHVRDWVEILGMKKA